MPRYVIIGKPVFMLRLSYFFIICCILQFSAAWIYPPTSFSGISTVIQDKIFGVPFQYALWLAVFLTFLFDATRNGFDFYVNVIKPFLPFFLFGMFSSVFGIMPMESIRLIALYWVMACAAILPVSIANVRAARIASYNTFFTLILISVLVSILLPQIGAQSYGTVVAWRGLFTNKNAFGWFSAIALIIAVVFFDKKRISKSLLFIILPVVALLFSQSKGALVSAGVSLLFVPLLVGLQRRVSLWLAVLFFFVISVFISGLVYFFFTDVLLLLGRDVTLTGRTVIWGMYFNSMSGSPFLGGGPGSYTSLTELTLPLAYRLQDMGAILTPHNIYLAAFGELGVFGLFSFVGILIYFAFFQYFNFPNLYSLACAAVSILLLIGGFSDTHEVFSAGLSMFVMILFRAMALKQFALKIDKVNRDD
ncbi:hypothetical protein DKK66_15835 [Aquitalea sp. USM4]|nr:hypothetical protein DKK66_15835 [Aquitalea sp. USM4]